jgi:hypothetical protein
LWRAEGRARLSLNSVLNASSGKVKFLFALILAFEANTPFFFAGGMHA